jgi:hypothetical protein
MFLRVEKTLHFLERYIKNVTLHAMLFQGSLCMNLFLLVIINTMNPILGTSNGITSSVHSM